MIKTLTQYLAEHGGNHEAALNAMHADLTTQARETEREAATNIRARTIAQHLQPLAEALSIPLPEPGQRPTQDATTALQEAVTGAIQGIEDLEAGLEEWQGVARDAGLDVDGILKEQDPTKVEAAIDGWLGGLTAAREGQSASAQELAVYQFAHENGLNPKAVLLQRGLDGLTRRDVTTKDASGNDVTTPTWGIPGQGDAFTPALTHLEPVMAALKPQTQQQSGTGWVSGQEQRGSGAPASPFASVQTQQQAAPVNPFTFTTPAAPAATGGTK
ncbi:hypothetical protein [Deinococcus sp. 6GRE01]|uniref:hypothetical protein n=1 Tax=Deinococcus sp. 6GRE01 TaxID=2745873 RepID=UPI001E5B06DE|nr:hypothetical protein [Deinococcus sp. 6GRE01]MCD0156020.1 hypothetical protein [Deinococcus sp. 6GRE01]